MRLEPVDLSSLRLLIGSPACSVQHPSALAPFVMSQVHADI